MSAFAHVTNLVLLVIILILIQPHLDRWQKQFHKHWKSFKQPQWKPASPHDCEMCCNQLSLQVIKQCDVVPYHQTKSSRGRKKSVSTRHFACPKPNCHYCGIADDTVHALVGYGHHNGIPRFKCQACGKVFTSRIGERTKQDAFALTHDVQQRLLPGHVPAFTTDGLRTYFYAITAHFGSWFRPPRARKDHWQVSDDLQHGMLIKRKHKNRKTITTTRMAYGKRSDLFDKLQQVGLRRLIQTAFIERVNLTFLSIDIERKIPELTGICGENLRFFTPLATFLTESACFRSPTGAEARLELSTVYVCCTQI